MAGTGPTVYMPEQAGTAVAPDGRKLVFLYVPQLALPIKQVLAAHPGEYTYRWGYHSGHRIHVLLAYWAVGQDGVEMAVSLPEGAGDALLDFMTGETDVYITADPIRDRLKESMSHQEIEQMLLSTTVGLTQVCFKGRRGG